jgi:hypothetical protein
MRGKIGVHKDTSIRTKTRTGAKTETEDNALSAAMKETRRDTEKTSKKLVLQVESETDATEYANGLLLHLRSPKRNQVKSPITVVCVWVEDAARLCS